MTFPYVVKRGDTLHRVARRYGMNVTALYGANPHLKEHNYLYPGQVVHIPVRTTSRYVIQAGDTLWDLALRFNISLTELQSANPDADPRRLRIGQTIVLPVSKGLTIVETDVEYGYAELMDNLDRLLEAYPFLEMTLIGQSVLGKDIPAVRIGTGPREVHYNGAFHANEWMTSLLLIKFIEDYAAAYAGRKPLRNRDMTALYEQTSLWVVPMVNPDGVELVQQGATPGHPYYKELLRWNYDSQQFSRWKANIRGVDLNDQFPAHWEAERDRREVPGPGPRDYAGPAPLSEPEAQAIEAFTRGHSFRLAMAFHTQGREIYWNYRGQEPPEAEEAARRLAKASGYRAVELTGSDAGYKDWFIQEFGRLGFTIEAGIGINPLPIGQFPQMYDEVIGIMLEGLKL
ncbi:g-D-glutamyl-meso-diaminopimelate peptidase [Paenibacillus tianmuensis]|uniref:G-D-glutamyl-meso-diaminopimelate peptidase n=1 Tax=Paenibacillus tianmuensis TaxID=624147 RepID=A0A1G4RTX8_9BACL|nr:M14 family zinc carboxypeptidase [Paenibacillus tianmuensis]SCW59559.1 g-D-glutamyl-meso-diaminopimelate peptidase [Paenibacillus tianmuensis]